MADIIVDGKTRVFAVPTIANPSAMTLAELTAGEPIHDSLVPTGLQGFEGSQAEVDNTALSSRQDSKLPGRKSFSGTNLVIKKQSGADPVFDLLSVEGTNTNIVIFDGTDAEEDVVVGDDYEVYPVRTGDYEYQGRGEANSLLRVMIPTPVSKGRTRGTVAAA